VRNIGSSLQKAEGESEMVWGDMSGDYEDSTPSGPEIHVSRQVSKRIGDDDDSEQDLRRSRILTRKELLYLLSTLPRMLGIRAQEKHGGRICAGMVGYPNVGKSSVINTLLGVSRSSHGVVRVGVSSTPGKTKHFQTLMLNTRVMLCDCPGLVFPSFMNSTGEMLCAGILPFNQMRDYTDPATVIASRVPKHLLDAAYGMKIVKELDIMDNPDRPPTASEMLCAYCKVKGYITNGTGRWDEFRACKDILKDFNDGKVLYVSHPPVISAAMSGDPVISGVVSGDAGVDMARWLSDIELIMMKRAKVADRVLVQKIRDAEVAAEEEERQLQSVSSLSIHDADIVFGDNYTKPSASNKPEYDDESDDDDGITLDGDTIATGTSTANNGTEKREHKRLKHWGKKNKKLRDKNPYAEENGVVPLVAHSTNRSMKPLSLQDKEKVKRQDPRQAYGNTFVRASQPYQVVVPDHVTVPSGND